MKFKNSYQYVVFIGLMIFGSIYYLFQLHNILASNQLTNDALNTSKYAVNNYLTFPTKEEKPPPEVSTVQSAIFSPTQRKTTHSAFFDIINDYRLKHGRSASSEDARVCAFARIRAEEISIDFSHDKFESRIIQNTLPYPSYTHVTENIAYIDPNSDPITMWKNSSTHEENLLQDTPYICVQVLGAYAVFEGWKP